MNMHDEGPMKTYARIADGRVVEIIEPMVYDISSPPDVEPVFQAGDEVPIERRFTDSFVDTLVEISGAAVSVGDVYANGSFSPYIPPAPSLADVVARNTAMRDALLTEAGARIAPLQDAVDLGDATDAETALLKSWKQFRVAVNRIDLTAASPAWPAEPA